MRLGDIWAECEALDGKTPAAGQTALFRELAYLARGQTYWFARRLARDPASVQSMIDAYRPSTDKLRELLPGVLSTFEQREAVRRAERWTKAGAPKDIAHAVAVLRPLTLAGTLADLSRASAWPFEAVARLYHAVGGAFDFDRLRAAAGSRVSGDAYERLAVRRLVEDLSQEQAMLTRAIIDFAGRHESADTSEAAKKTVSAWTSMRLGAVRAAKRTIADIEKSGGDWTFAKLTIANAALRELSGA
jgi:glutamate dehydrogenase